MTRHTHTEDFAIDAPHPRVAIRTAKAMCDDIDAGRIHLIRDTERKVLWLVCCLAVVGGIVGGTMMEAAITAFVAGGM